MRLHVALSFVFLLSACVAPRMHGQAELNSLGLSCGLALGELFQDESEKRLLFVVAPSATPAQRSCVIRWAKRHRLKPVIVDKIEFKES
ncbi:MAG TPA: hypothetical protein VFO42_05335 [Sphingomicrobium sp.]|nr:hypothetical protein [Sphingomicrobium sp.]